LNNCVLGVGTFEPFRFFFIVCPLVSTTQPSHRGQAFTELPFGAALTRQPFDVRALSSPPLPLLPHLSHSRGVLALLLRLCVPPARCSQRKARSPQGRCFRGCSTAPCGEKQRACGLDDCCLWLHPMATCSLAQRG
jgi:hypothetical protein